jgi:hypothetical protein
MSQKQHYTLQDMLVVQYILNDGILMRQRHGSTEEYHIDIQNPFDDSCCAEDDGPLHSK